MQNKCLYMILELNMIVVVLPLLTGFSDFEATVCKFPCCCIVVSGCIGDYYFNDDSARYVLRFLM